MSLLPEYFPDLTGFQWDAGNSEKNWLAHDASQAETEQVFFGRPVVIMHDAAHSQDEVRHYLLGRTHAGRRLTVVFTMRESLVRPILARDMSRRERRLYAEQEDAEEAPEADSPIP
ncbi:MAG: BrnT family toxin [Gemmatimonadales bacterium]